MNVNKRNTGHYCKTIIYNINVFVNYILKKHLPQFQNPSHLEMVNQELATIFFLAKFCTYAIENTFPCLDILFLFQMFTKFCGKNISNHYI
jgi:hypothetical protein